MIKTHPKVRQLMLT
ncbi:MAG: hypothetical protein DME29_01340 [Verrucomicrobia bacterium]|nr:MAG: hypothetical protein DMC57_00060 [Verrucomicrobiota bacterium]PYL45628.1 MAG: hypothetical protein DME29_01340 [Verrucomicrobiota bacterium]